jgi:hypothetical protein
LVCLGRFPSGRLAARQETGSRSGLALTAFCDRARSEPVRGKAWPIWSAARSATFAAAFPPNPARWPPRSRLANDSPGPAGGQPPPRGGPAGSVAVAPAWCPPGEMTLGQASEDFGRFRESSPCFRPSNWVQGGSGQTRPVHPARAG